MLICQIIQEMVTQVAWLKATSYRTLSWARSLCFFYSSDGSLIRSRSFWLRGP